MPSLIKWRQGGQASRLSVVRAAGPLPAYTAGRGRGRAWPLPPLNSANAAVYMAESALPALLAAYEEYVDRYLVSHDYDRPPRRWLHENVPADEGVLDYVFPLLTGSSEVFATEVFLIRLVWLIQQYPGLEPLTTPTEIIVNTTLGPIGIRNGRILFRFVPGGVPVPYATLISSSLAVGHLRVFNKALNSLYTHLKSEERLALTMLLVRVRPKSLLKKLYDDGLVTGSHLGFMRSIDDKILSIEAAVLRSPCPADTLETIMVPEYLSKKEYRQVFHIPWSREKRKAITGQYLIRRMPLVRQYLETA